MISPDNKHCCYAYSVFPFTEEGLEVKFGSCCFFFQNVAKLQMDDSDDTPTYSQNKNLLFKGAKKQTKEIRILNCFLLLLLFVFSVTEYLTVKYKTDSTLNNTTMTKTDNNCSPGMSLYLPASVNTQYLCLFSLSR